MSVEREECVYQAKLAEQAERYDEMVQAMKQVAEMNVELTVEERNLLSVAYKNVIGARRASWRIISSIEQKEKEKPEDKVKLIKEYKEQIMRGICSLCTEVVDLLDANIVPNSSSMESKVFYQKMLGDYERYKAEVMDGSEREQAAERSLTHYGSASTLCKEEDGLDACNPIRLGLALNQSVFFYEIMGRTEKACELAQEAISCAIEEIQKSKTHLEDRKDATLILQLLQDNLKLWHDPGYSQGNEDDQELQDVDDDED